MPVNKIRRNLKQRLLRSAQQPTGGVYYQYIFFPHFRRCKDKKKNNINQQKLEEILKKRLLRYAQHLTGVYIINIFSYFSCCKDKHLNYSRQ